MVRQSVLCIDGFYPAWGRKCVMAAAGSRISQPVIELDLLGPSCALWPWIPPDGSKPEPSLPGPTWCLSISVCFKKRRGFGSFHLGPGRGCDQLSFLFLPSGK